MPKATLSAAFITTARCESGKKKTDFYDSKITGFVFERRCTGKGTYYLRYQDQAGRQRQFKIGGSEDISFAAAQKKAQQLRSEVVMGGDPTAQKALVRSTPTYASLAKMHLDDALIHQKSFPTTEMVIRRHILPRWGKVRLTDIDSRDVAVWLNDKRKGGLAPATVVKIKAIFGRSFELGSRWGVAGCDKNPVRGIPQKPLNNARNRFLSPEEATRLKAAAAKSQNPQLKHVVSLLLLTGARKRELLDAKWIDVDIERRMWLIPTSKTGRGRHIPLSTAALETIAHLPRPDGCPWLVPNLETGLPYVSLKTAWKGVIKTANLPGLRIHDLRHSAASFLVASGVPLYTVGKVLGHANVASTARYSHIANDGLLAAVEAGAAQQIIA